MLSLLVLQPPVRSGVYVSCIIQNTAKINDIDNYLILTHKAGSTKRAYYYINSDKVSNTKSYSDIIKNILEIVNKQLINSLLG